MAKYLHGSWRTTDGPVQTNCRRIASPTQIISAASYRSLHLPRQLKPTLEGATIPKMLLSSLFVSLLTLIPISSAATSGAPPSLFKATLHALPSSPIPSSPKPLAVLAYHPLHPHVSRLESFTPPANTTDTAALTQVAIYMPHGSKDAITAGHLRTSATATNSFHTPYKGRFRITVNAEGEVLSASWHAYLPKNAATKGVLNGKGKDSEIASGRGDFDIMTVKPAPGVVFDVPTKGKSAVAGIGAALGIGEQTGQTGQEGEEEVVEKTFLQK